MTTFQEKLIHYRKVIFDPALEKYLRDQGASSLYDPIRYLMNIGGKRLRPLLALAGAEAFGESPKKAADAALAVEVFHNFTLMHDDIMDHAPLRRGQQTVHEKWDANAAILSGDTMLVQSYELLAKYSAEKLLPLIKVFNQTAIEVCEGQQMDMNFETREDVALEEYLEMIKLKTSVLLGGSLRMGAIVAGAEETQQKHLQQFGINAGLAFQLQDDYLDAFGDPEKFGKQVGGDILADKKTFLWIHTFQNSDHNQKARMLDSDLKGEEKVAYFKEHFRDAGADTAIREKMEFYYQEAMDHLGACEIQEGQRSFFEEFARSLIERAH